MTASDRAYNLRVGYAAAVDIIDFKLLGVTEVLKNVFVFIGYRYSHSYFVLSKDNILDIILYFFAKIYIKNYFFTW